MPRGYDRRTVLKGTAAGLTASIAGCLAGDDDGEGEGPPYDVDVQGSDADRDDVMVGVLQPVTGDLGELGGPIRDAAILPGAQLEGETDFTFDVQDEDSESDPEAGVSAAEALVDAGYPCVTGAASSEVTRNVAEGVFIPNGIVGCSPASTSPAITDMEDDDYIFRTCPSDALQGEVMAQVGYEEEGLESAATFYLNNEYGELLAESFVDAFEELGGEVTDEVAFEPEQPSYTSPLENVLSGDPDLLIVIGYPASGTQIFRDYYGDFSADQTVMVTDGLREPSLPADVDNPMENVIGTAPLASGPEADTFADLYQDEFGSEPGVFTAQAYDASAVLLLANLAAGENDGESIRNQMRNVANSDEGEAVGPSNLAEAVEIVAGGDPVDYQGASSAVDFDENGDMQAVTYEIFGFTEDGVEQTDTVEFGQ